MLWTGFIFLKNVQDGEFWIITIHTKVKQQRVFCVYGSYCYCIRVLVITLCRAVQGVRPKRKMKASGIHSIVFLSSKASVI